MLLGYRCSVCRADYSPGELTYTCPADGGVLDVLLDVDAVKRAADPATIAASTDPSLWRYQALLPVAPPTRPMGPLSNVGGTPLYDAPRAAARAGVQRAWIKDDGRLPTASLKDRASAVVAMRAREIGVDRVITASTGNAGVALAAMANAADLGAVVLVPRSAPPAKIAQLMVFGAELYLVDGSYDDAYRLTLRASEELGLYCRNTGYNPFTAEGKKTVAFEICEALGGTGGFRAPDRIFVSVGDGNIISGVHKGLKDLLALGWIERMPRLMGVQAEGSAAVARAFDAGRDTIEPVVARTVADSIAADMPSDGLRALKAVRETGGAYLTVSDEQILAAIPWLGKDATVFAEPAAAAAYAGLCACPDLDPAEEVVVLVTGNGLKDTAAATRATDTPVIIEPSVEALRRALEKKASP